MRADAIGEIKRVGQGSNVGATTNIRFRRRILRLRQVVAGHDANHLRTRTLELDAARVGNAV